MLLTLVAQWALAGTPEEALLDGLLDAQEKLLVNLAKRWCEVRTRYKLKRGKGRDTRTSDGSVSSMRMLGPFSSGPKAQMEREASRSHWYLLSKCFPRSLGVIRIVTRPDSMSSEIPGSSGSAIIVSLFLECAARRSVFCDVVNAIRVDRLLVRRFSVDLESTRLNHRLTELDDRVRNLDLDLTKESSQVATREQGVSAVIATELTMSDSLKNRVEVKLARAEDDVLSALLDLG